MGKFNLTFRICQTSIFEDKDLKIFIDKFKLKFNEIISQFNYRNDEIYNLDETGLLFEIVPEKII